MLLSFIVLVTMAKAARCDYVAKTAAHQESCRTKLEAARETRVNASRLPDHEHDPLRLPLSTPRVTRQHTEEVNGLALVDLQRVSIFAERFSILAINSCGCEKSKHHLRKLGPPSLKTRMTTHGSMVTANIHCCWCDRVREKVHLSDVIDLDPFPQAEHEEDELKQSVEEDCAQQRVTQTGPQGRVIDSETKLRLTQPQLVFVLQQMLSGGGYINQEKAAQLGIANTMSQHAFDRARKIINQYFRQFAEVSIQRHRAVAKNGGLTAKVVSITDGSWSHHRNSISGCVAMMVPDGDGHLHIVAYHTMTKDINYAGSSKGMEATGIRICNAQLEADGFVIIMSVNDGDCQNETLREEYNDLYGRDCKGARDPGHWKINFHKFMNSKPANNEGGYQLYEFFKSEDNDFTHKDYSEWQKGFRIVHDLTLSRIAAECSAESESDLTEKRMKVLYKKWLKVADHTLSATHKHTQCDSDWCKVCGPNGDKHYVTDKFLVDGEPSQWPVSKKGHNLLVRILKERVSPEQLKSLLLGFKTNGTQSMESFHNIKGRLLNKTVSRSHDNQDGLTCAAIVIFNEGWEFLVRRLFSSFNLSLSEKQVKSLVERSRRAAECRLEQQKPEKKRERKRRKLNLREKDRQTDAAEPALYKKKSAFKPKNKTRKS